MRCRILAPCDTIEGTRTQSYAAKAVARPARHGHACQKQAGNGHGRQSLARRVLADVSCGVMVARP
jgi:hypothetical protein